VSQVAGGWEVESIGGGGVDVEDQSDDIERISALVGVVQGLANDSSVIPRGGVEHPWTGRT